MFQCTFWIDPRFNTRMLMATLTSLSYQVGRTEFENSLRHRRTRIIGHRSAANRVAFRARCHVDLIITCGILLPPNAHWCPPVTRLEHVNVSITFSSVRASTFCWTLAQDPRGIIRIYSTRSWNWVGALHYWLWLHKYHYSTGFMLNDVKMDPNFDFLFI